MMKKFVFILGLFCTTAARAATCSAGYYLKNGECLQCNPNNEPYYCPGDDIRHPCPKTNTDYNQFGYILKHGYEDAWAPLGTSSPYGCYSGLFFRDEFGNTFLLEERFNGENYWGDRKLWYIAGPGYYLSEHRQSSSADRYKSVKPCTNAPDHAHYTGPGTPDEPKSGGATDYNDCPWECDDGYGLHDGECVPLCDGGMRYIKTSNGLQFNLYPVVYSTPALHVKRDETVCHAVLAPGAAKNSININHNGQIYHTVD